MSVTIHPMSVVDPKARLGEGVLNGLMTARFGLAAIEVCRPLPYIRENPPKLADVAGDLLTREPDDTRRTAEK